MSANFLSKSVTALVRHALAEGASIETIFAQVVDGVTQSHQSLGLQELFTSVSQMAGRQPLINTAAIQRQPLITPAASAATPVPAAASTPVVESDMNLVFMGGNLNTISSMPIPAEFQSSPQDLMQFVNTNLINHEHRMDIAQVWISNKGAIAGRYHHDRVNGTLSPL